MRVTKVTIHYDNGAVLDVPTPTAANGPERHWAPAMGGFVIQHTTSNNVKPRDGIGRWLDHEIRWSEPLPNA